MRPNFWRRAALVLLGWLACALGDAAALQACSIPVFRYALERWKASPYEVVVFSRGPLDGNARAALLRLDHPEVLANVEITVIDLNAPVEPYFQKIWDRFGQIDKQPAPTPWMVIRYPDVKDSFPPAWVGSVSDENCRKLADSPLRREIAQRLVRQAHTAVWLLLESGDAAKDDAVAALLEKELARLERVIELPEQSAEGPQLQSGLPLQLKFSYLRLSRPSGEEQLLAEFLSGSEEGLKAVQGPIVFPLFGRGRLLCALHGDDLNPKQLQNVAVFLCGACSCQVKELNPGMDLLFATDWPKWLAAVPLADQRHRPSLPATTVSGSVLVAERGANSATETDPLESVPTTSTLTNSAPHGSRAATHLVPESATGKTTTGKTTTGESLPGEKSTTLAAAPVSRRSQRQWLEAGVVLAAFLVLLSGYRLFR